jgi:hypothetical protein
MPAVGSSISSSLGLVGHGHGQLHALDVAVGQHAAGPVGLGLHADLVEQRERLVALVVGRAAPHGEQLAVVREHGHLHVLHHGERGEGLGDLEGAAHALAPDVARLQAHQLVPVEQDGALVGPQLAVDHVEGGRLARAVGADEREQFAGVQLEADAVDGPDAAEGLAEVLTLSKLMFGVPDVLVVSSWPRQRGRRGHRARRPCRDASACR